MFSIKTHDERITTFFADIGWLTELTVMNVAFNWVWISDTEFMVVSRNKTMITFITEVIFRTRFTIFNITLDNSLAESIN